MKIFFILLCVLVLDLFAVNFGTILSNDSNESNLIANDIKLLLKNYKIDIRNEKVNSSYEAIQKLLEKEDNSYFAIVNKDAITYYNKTQNSKYSQKSIYNDIPAILSLGSEQIHIFTSNKNDFDFELQKKFKVYCGEKNSDSCIALDYIQKAYKFNFEYINSNEKSIFHDLKSNKIDLYISVKKAPYSPYVNLKGLNLIDLPTNFKMEDMYIHSTISNSDYPYIDDKIHSFSASRVLITNLNESKYKNIITSFLKVILLNKEYLIKDGKLYWEDIDFLYFEYKKFSLEAKKTIKKLEQKIKAKDALIF